jgi:hypothetical protein
MQKKKKSSHDHVLFFGQVVCLGTEEIWPGGLEEHIAQFCPDQDAYSGGQPCAEVLHEAQLRRQRREEIQHPRHHHS